tara:strand:- start:209 stop:529 length:321 start_codon:yes stop_codon:yes gene_type:complete
MGNNLLSFLPLLIVLAIFGVIIWFIVRMRRNEKIVIDENGNAIRSGLGGWLIFVGIGLVVSPLRNLSVMFTDFLPMFNNGTYEILTTPDNAAYHPFWGAYLWGEII